LGCLVSQDIFSPLSLLLRFVEGSRLIRGVRIVTNSKGGEECYLELDHTRQMIHQPNVERSKSGGWRRCYKQDLHE